MKAVFTKKRLVAAAAAVCLLAAAWFYGSGYLKVGGSVAADTSLQSAQTVQASAGNEALVDPSPDSGGGEAPLSPPAETPAAGAEEAADGAAFTGSTADETAQSSAQSGTQAASSPASGAGTDTGEGAQFGGYIGAVETGELDAGTSTGSASGADTGSPAGAEKTCTLSVTCASILADPNRLDPDKRDILPEDGVLFPAAEVSFAEGETAFDVLQRKMKEAGIPMEFTSAAVYGSKYIEGIANIYEFDCGELSGWMYRVNGGFPGYGCSRYTLSDGDEVEFVYTCDLGHDVGGDYASNTGG